ncbi:hypothetical protein BGZ83_001956 [Gryganskiella cystojenkinii]|nr:hypothetical protein BGZ83_001956 [Gryganskiella cystojenkinii]
MVKRRLGHIIVNHPSIISTSAKKSLRSRVFFKSDHVDEVQEAWIAVESMNAKGSQYGDTMLGLKDHVRRPIQTPEYYDQVNNADPKVKRQKYMLSGDLSKEGYNLRIMAYTLTERKGSSQLTIFMASNVVVASSGSS